MLFSKIGLKVLMRIRNRDTKGLTKPSIFQLGLNFDELLDLVEGFWCDIEQTPNQVRSEKIIIMPFLWIEPSY